MRKACYARKRHRLIVRLKCTTATVMVALLFGSSSDKGKVDRAHTRGRPHELQLGWQETVWIRTCGIEEENSNGGLPTRRNGICGQSGRLVECKRRVAPHRQVEKCISAWAALWTTEQSQLKGVLGSAFAKCQNSFLKRRALWDPVVLREQWKEVPSIFSERERTRLRGRWRGSLRQCHRTCARERVVR